MPVDAQYNCLIIIQSLEEDENSPGKELMENINNLNIKIIFEEIEGRKDFLKLLTKLENDMKKKTLKPIIHIEAHGRTEIRRLEKTNDAIHDLYITFKNKSEIKLSEITNSLCRINELSEFNLILSFSCCFGANSFESLLIQYLKNKTMSPFLAIIGPEGKKDTKDLLDTFIMIYTLVADGKSFYEISKSINLNYGNWLFWDIYSFIVDFTNGYISKDISEEQIHATTTTLSNKIKFLGKSKSFSFTPSDKFIKNKKIEYWNNQISTLLAFDRIKGNRERFNDITVEKILNL
nr:hypothetical protein [uncultured Dethiosulfovibrio sp.]